MRRAALLLLLASFGASAVVIRDDVPDLQYRMAASEFPALADLPGEGHGVLIAPQWVITAAHAVSWQHAVEAVVVGGTPRAVRRIVIHPGYKKPPQEMIDAALKSGDWKAFFEFIASSDDIALIQLAEPVRDVAPARIYNGSAMGKVVRIMGRGATGTGSNGHSLHGPNRIDLRHGYNQISVSEGRWIGYAFDKPPNALPLEASTGSGDSGGPILIAVNNEWHVAGITAWKRAEVKGTEIRPGRYGETSYGVRLGNYADWITQAIEHQHGPGASGTSTYGKPFADGAAVPVSQAIASFDAHAGQPRRFSGRITEVCQAKGCWMMLEHEGKVARVMFGNHAFFLPKDTRGAAVVHGVLERKQLTAEQAGHLAADSGKRLAVDPVEYRIVADGVRVADAP